MRLERVHTKRAVILQLLLYALPTIALIFLVLYNFNAFFDLLENDFIIQGVYFAAGIILSIIFYARNFRISTTFILLLIIYALAFMILGNISLKDFDIFSSSIQFISFSFLFSLGWLVGYGFSRWNGFTITWVILLLATQIYVISRTDNISVQNILTNFLPSIFYCFYIIYITELIKNTDDQQSRYTWTIIRKVISFFFLFLLIFVPLIYFFNDEFTRIEKEWQKAQPQYNEKKKDTENMTRQNKDGTIENKESTQLAGNLSKGKRLVFVAYLDNFLEDGIPNPLYFTSLYYTKFDTLTQTFEIDKNMPLNDLYKPDPSKIPLYFIDTDSGVIRNGMSSLGRKEVTANVYKAILSPDEYIAPATAFYCQPISIPKDYKEQFKSAYTAKMWVSELNSAYFVYNPAGDENAEAFQQRRFNILHTDTNYTGIDKNFLDYYTTMPTKGSYEKIVALANQITIQANARTNAEKMLAIRNYFLSLDEFGQPLFKYSDNPGVPGIPSANKLTYFLLDNRKGYCSYFAGSTLLLLRALGIPSRIAAGFLTVDRSSKNQGWYWFYEDQAHAWVQVFFPNYGWIDFDTTIPNTSATQSSQPDGTPPIGLPDATFIADGNIKSIDTLSKQVELEVSRIIVKDKNYEGESHSLLADISTATLSADTGTIALQLLKPGMHVTAVSYQEDFKKLDTGNKNFRAIVQQLPALTPVDEIKVIEQTTEEEKKPAEEAPQETFNWLKVLSYALFSMLFLLLFLAALPYLTWLYFMATAGRSLHNQNRAINYYLNQLGFYRNKISPLQFAENIDDKFGTSFARFTAVYQKNKYSKSGLSDEEKLFAQQHFKDFMKRLRKNIPFKTRLLHFLNLYSTTHYFVKNN